jgi:intracellular sulfur oxidation DsrE/DsrF family protein
VSGELPRLFRLFVTEPGEKYERARDTGIAYRHSSLEGRLFFGFVGKALSAARQVENGLILVGILIAIELKTSYRGLRIIWLFGQSELRRIIVRRWIHRTAAAALASLTLVSVALAADTKAQHRLLIQVDQNDPAVMNLALNNATNVIEYYRSKGQEVAVDVVTYGPGLHMLRADTSPVQDRIKQLKNVAFPSKIQFSACNVTREGMEKKEGHPIDIMSDAVLVPSGVIHLMESQEAGWSYIRP